MAIISNLGPQRIEDTYQLLVQTDGVSLYSGDGKKLNISGSGGTSLSDDDIAAVKNVSQLTDRVVALEARQDKVVSSSSYDADTNILTLHIENDDANPVNIDMTQLYDDALNGYAKSTDVTTQISTLSGSINTTLEKYVTSDELPNVPTKLSDLADDTVIAEATKASQDGDGRVIKNTYLEITTYTADKQNLTNTDTQLNELITNETSARTTADATLQTNIDAANQLITDETSARTAANTTLQASIDAANKAISDERTRATNAENLKYNIADDVWVSATNYASLTSVDSSKTYFITEL